ncbi:MlaD family protein [Desulfobacula sp.]|uniref:PqiB family protein n=1 Tax=Desulfobacula sp. TaxID=2593537 RepID=UPI002627F390|nr:MlaD family protein [Desulfobacula sp.]
MKELHTEPVTPATAPVPVIKNRSWPSVVWLIPLITALIGGWLIVKTISEKGPQIEITFKTAEGIEAGKTKIKYKEIEIGMVESVHFSKDFSHIILKADMEKGSAPFLRRGTHFWVVKPRLSLRGATGLNTLLSGSYIEIEPGQGAFQKHFEGLDKPPVVKADVDGTKIMILAEKLNSIDTGSPIYYQGILAGEILGWELGNDRKSIFIHAFVKAPYNRLVKSNTRFWNISGMDVSIGSEGISVRTESLQSLLYGGIAFETPDTLEQVKENVDGLVFTLHDDYQSIQEESFIKKITFILFFEGSVRGLSVGAPVEFKGIKIGMVKDVRLEFNGDDASFRIPVLIEIEPGRVISQNEGDNATLFQTLNLLVDRGLRARLQTGSLLTGQLYVDLGMHPDTPVRMVNAGTPYPELPTIPANLEQMTTSVKNILARMEKLNIDKIGSELLKTLQGANQLINKPELADAVEDFQASLQLLKNVLHKLDQHVEPLTMNLETAIGAGHEALQKAQVTLGLVDEVLKPGSPLQFRFIELTSELAEMARSIRTLVDMFERHPNAILFGKTVPGGK